MAEIRTIGSENSVREHLSGLTAMDPSVLASYAERDGKWKVQWSGELRDVERIVGILDRMKMELLIASRS